MLPHKCQLATGDGWCSACSGSTCTACWERPAYGQPMSKHKIQLDAARKRVRGWLLRVTDPQRTAQWLCIELKPSRRVRPNGLPSTMLPSRCRAVRVGMPRERPKLPAGEADSDLISGLPACCGLLQGACAAACCPCVVSHKTCDTKTILPIPHLPFHLHSCSATLRIAASSARPGGRWMRSGAAPCGRRRPRSLGGGEFDA